MINPKKLGSALRQWRRDQGLNQREVADMLGCAQATISMIERGYFDDLGVNTTQRICDLIGEPITEFIESPQVAAA